MRRHTLDGAFFSLVEQNFELCEDLLDRIEVGAIRRQEDEPGARGTDGPADTGGPYRSRDCP